MSGDPTPYQLRRRAAVAGYLGRELTTAEAEAVDGAGQVLGAFGESVAAKLAPEDLDDLRRLLGAREELLDVGELLLRRVVGFLKRIP